MLQRLEVAVSEARLRGPTAPLMVHWCIRHLYTYRDMQGLRWQGYRGGTAQAVPSTRAALKKNCCVLWLFSLLTAKQKGCSGVGDLHMRTHRPPYWPVLQHRPWPAGLTSSGYTSRRTFPVPRVFSLTAVLPVTGRLEPGGPAVLPRRCNMPTLVVQQAQLYERHGQMQDQSRIFKGKG